MTTNHQRFHRRSIRLRGFDYSQPGDYFITICTYNRTLLFGKIIDGSMKLNISGQIVQEEWEKTGLFRPNIELGPFVIMPNHIHGIIRITEIEVLCRTSRINPVRIEQFGKALSESIPTIIRAFKSAVTKRINLCRKTPGESIWQSNYWEKIIRNESSYNQIAGYINSNPSVWEKDQLFSSDDKKHR